MRKAELRMNELEKYNVIKDVVRQRKTKERAMIELSLSKRQINRLIIKYHENGKYGFIHGNRGRKPITALNEEFKDIIADLYITKYFDCTYTLFSELLAEREGIYLSIDTVRKILLERDILSPKVHRCTKKIMKKKLQQLLRDTKSKKKKEQIQTKIKTVDSPPPLQPRCDLFGEEIQMDASNHNWFGRTKTTLHAAIDDSTGKIVGAYFDKEETLNGYYNVTYQILTLYGIPYKIKTDKRTVFEYKKKGIISDENDTFTQYSYAAKQLVIQIETSSIPEFKPRIERLFETLQNRLNVWLRLHNVNSIKEANTILPRFIEQYNSKFSLPVNDNKIAFEKQISEEKISLTLSVISRRTIDSGHSIKFKKEHYRLVNSRNIPIYFAKGTKCMVIESFDKQLFATVDEHIFALQKIPKFQANSYDYDNVEELKIQYVYIPKMIHPWKAKSFNDFVERQAKKFMFENELVLT